MDERRLGRRGREWELVDWQSLVIRGGTLGDGLTKSLDGERFAAEEAHRHACFKRRVSSTGCRGGRGGRGGRNCDVILQMDI